MMRKILALHSLCVLCALGLQACVTSGGSSASNSSLEWNETITSLDTAKHILTTAEPTYYCLKESTLAITSVDTLGYSISGGALYLWNIGGCSAEKYLGHSDSLFGSWKFDSGGVAIPALAQRSDCPILSNFGNGGGEQTVLQGIFRNPTGTVAISAMNLDEKVSGELCDAPGVAAELAESMDSVEVISSDCGSARLSSEKTHRTATLSVFIDPSDEEIVISVAADSRVCSLSESIPGGAKPTCPIDAGSSVIAFDACLDSAGFSQGIPPQQSSRLLSERLGVLE